MAYSFSSVCSNVLPEGTYKMQISEIKFKESKDRSTSFNMEVHYVVADGPFEKRTVIDTIYEKAFAFRLKPFLTAVGIDMSREFETAKELYEYGVRAAKGVFLMAEVGVRVYNGNKYNEIKTWAPLPGSSVSADDVLAEFGTNPETLPKAPKISDLQESDDFAPIAEIADDDFPF